MKHCMLDLETWGTRPGCAIRSIGAIFFDPQSDAFGPEFYVNVSRASCEQAGLFVDPNTEAWWARQSLAARAALDADQRPLADALGMFTSFFHTNGAEYLWSHGANFDGPVLEACYVAEGTMQHPWSFWNSRCTRTLFDLAGVDTKASGIKRTGVAHNALDDARFQAKCVQAAMRRITVHPQRPVAAAPVSQPSGEDVFA